MAKILVVEDEVSVRESITDILNAEDFIVDTATNGEEGLQQIQEFHPDLVICDVMMPVLDGYGLLKQVRQMPDLATLPFVFLTAKADRSDFRSGMDLGADDYLTKPFTHSDLLRMIETRLGARSTVQQQTQQQLDTLRSSISTSLPRNLGAPMTEILALAATLVDKAETYTPEEVVTSAKAIHRNAQQVVHLIQNVVLFSRLDRLDPNAPTAIAMRQHKTQKADQLVSEVAHRIAAEHLREDDLEISLEPLTLPMSEVKLKKVCEELIDNAFKFSPTGTPVKVFGSHRDGVSTLYVIDYGQGMDVDEIAQLGAYRQFSTDGEDVQGTGLGLTIAKRMVELHQGEVIIESIPGQQTIIRIALPD